jgi:hypothetical protein
MDHTVCRYGLKEELCQFRKKFLSNYYNMGGSLAPDDKFQL